MDTNWIWFILAIISVFVTGVSCGMIIARIRGGLFKKFLGEHMGSLKETELDNEFRAWCAKRYPLRNFLLVR